MTTQNDIENVLWSACDTFRGKIDSSRYKDYILSMLFVKYLSDVYKETKDLKQIQETLRHSNINMSSKYAHLTERQENRYTNSIPVELE